MKSNLGKLNYFWLSSLVLFTFVFSPLGFAGNEKGNGGYAVVCQKATPGFVPIEILDFIEGRLLHDLAPEFGPTNFSYLEKLDYVLNRLSRSATTRAQLYRDWSAQFLSEAKFLKGIDLGDIGDTDHIAIPEGCHLKPVINQRTPSLPHEKRYFINQDLWEQLDADNKAGLILHELIYRELQSPTSVRVRFYNSLITSAIFEKLTLTELIQLHKDVGLNSLDIQGVEVNLLLPLEFYSNQKLKSAHPVPSSQFIFRTQALTLYSWFEKTDRRTPRIEFYEDGVLKAFVPNEKVNISTSSLPLQVRAFPEAPLTFWPNGSLEKAVIVMDQPRVFENPFVHIEGGRDPYSDSVGDTKATFYESGDLAYIQEGKGKALLEGDWVEIYRGFNNRGLELFANGRLKSALIKDSAKARVKQVLFTIKDQAYFYENGFLSFGYMTIPQAFAIQGRAVTFNNHPFPIEFYPHGEVRCGYLTQKEKLRSVDGTSPKEYSYSVCFNEQGLVDSKLLFTNKY